MVFLWDTPRKKNRKKESATRAALTDNRRRGLFFLCDGEQTAEPPSTPERSGANAERRARNGAAAGADGEKPAQTSGARAEDGDGKHKAGAKSGEAERAHRRELNITPLYYIARRKNFFGGQAPPRSHTAEKNFSECL